MFAPEIGCIIILPLLDNRTAYRAGAAEKRFQLLPFIVTYRTLQRSQIF